MPSLPRPEHPRPDFRRDGWLNLNGTWLFEFDPSDRGAGEGWHAGDFTFPREIVVPFPWESRLSRIEAPDYQGVAWYSRAFSVPDEWRGRRLRLVFGAVDWQAQVWVNGTCVGEHEGGYAPFDFDVTEAVAGSTENVLVVRVKDETRPEHPTGKQIRWYTRTSGIWQTVYLEAIGDAHVARVDVAPDVGGESATVSVRVTGEPGTYRLVAAAADPTVDHLEQVVTHQGGEIDVAVTLAIPNPRLWSPSDPQLYNLSVALMNSDATVDRVHTYFGMREVGRACYGENDFEYIHLNGEPVYLMGALHQSLHPDGIYAYPSDESIREDIRRAKEEFGFNTLRIHIKVDDPRIYYWADRLGVMILYDLPNTWADGEEPRAQWERMLHDAVARDFNHPSIIAWVLFNETWGIGDGEYTPETQAWVARMFEAARGLDPTRLVEDNSACRYDHVVTDLNSWHFYIDDPGRAREHIEEVVERTHAGSGFNYVEGRVQGVEPLLNSEYGSVSASGGDRDIAWGFKYLTNELRRHDKICGYIYTELTDIEWEHNGVMNYDRSPKEFGYDAHFPGFSVRDVNALDFLVLDGPPVRQVAGGGRVRVPVAVSHWSESEGRGLRLHWRVTSESPAGDVETLSSGSRRADWESYAVRSLGEIEVDLPTARRLYTLAAWAEDEGGTRLASNYTHVLVDGPNVYAGHGDPYPFCVTDFVESHWTGRAFDDVPSKAAGCGAGFVEYRVPLTSGASLVEVVAVELLFEGAAKADSEKLDWPERRKDQDYPQTDTTKYQSDVTVTLNGFPLGQVRLEDDPADARGVLSHMSGVHHGSYGYLTRLRTDANGELLSTVMDQGEWVVRFEVAADAENMGGLALYGAGSGRYPFDPCILCRR